MSRISTEILCENKDHSERQQGERENLRVMGPSIEQQKQIIELREKALNVQKAEQITALKRLEKIKSDLEQKLNEQKNREERLKQIELELNIKQRGLQSQHSDYQQEIEMQIANLQMQKNDLNAHHQQILSQMEQLQSQRQEFEYEKLSRRQHCSVNWQNNCEMLIRQQNMKKVI
jgi:chromosome segregation ATPase